MPPITIFCPFTRPHFVQRWFNDLASTDLNPAQVNLALTIDCEGDEGGKVIYARIMNEINEWAAAGKDFRKFIITRNYDHHVNEMSIPIRRQRIADIHTQSKDVVSALDGEFVLGLEDDTVFTNLCVQRLYQPFVDMEGIGLVSAYEAGRWHNKIIGIWNFDNVDDPKECWTELPGKGYEEIDAAGMYCYLTPTELYLKHDYGTDVIDPYGPDVRYGLDLRQQGYRNFVDWSQPCGHNDGDIIISPNSDLYVESFHWDDELKGWARKKLQ